MAEPSGPDEVVTEARLAEVLGVSVDTVQRAGFPCSYITPQRKVYLMSSVLRVLRERETTTEARERRGDAEPGVSAA